MPRVHGQRFQHVMRVYYYYVLKFNYGQWASPFFQGLSLLLLFFPLLLGGQVDVLVVFAGYFPPLRRPRAHFHVAQLTPCFRGYGIVRRINLFCALHVRFQHAPEPRQRRVENAQRVAVPARHHLMLRKMFDGLKAVAKWALLVQLAKGKAETSYRFLAGEHEVHQFDLEGGWEASVHRHDHRGVRRKCFEQEHVLIVDRRVLVPRCACQIVFADLRHLRVHLKPVRVLRLGGRRPHESTSTATNIHEDVLLLVQPENVNHLRH